MSNFLSMPNEHLHLIKPCLTLQASPVGPNRFFGQAQGHSTDVWPTYRDGEESLPLHLLAFIDTDTLPVEMQSAYGGPGLFVQLFVGHLDNNIWTLEKEPFAVLSVPKSLAVPLDFHPSLDMRSPVFFDFKPEKNDLPFETLKSNHADIQALFDWTRDQGINTEAFHEWEDKVGGWPSLEQGDMEQFNEKGTVLLQLGGFNSLAGDDYVFDGHGWLIKKENGDFIWATTSS